MMGRTEVGPLVLKGVYLPLNLYCPGILRSSLR